MALTDEEEAELRAELAAARASSDPPSGDAPVIIAPPPEPTPEVIHAQADAAVQVIQAEAAAAVKVTEAQTEQLDTLAEAEQARAALQDDGGLGLAPDRRHWYFK